jgi:four helix bundle protein
VHCQVFVTGVKKVEEFAALQMADAFKSEVFALLKCSREAMRDRRFRYQLKDSASGPPKHINEGFSPRDFCRFLDYALGSLREAHRTLRLKHSQERYAEQLERERRARSKLKKADKHQVPRTRRTSRTD